MIKTINYKIMWQENQVIFNVNGKVYPLEAIYGASYTFLDRAYVFLDGDPNKIIRIYLKGKEKFSQKDLEKLVGEFSNELLNYALRIKIAERNKRIREYIVGTALFSANPDLGAEDLLGKEEEELDWKKDPLGIAKPWEEKFGKKNKAGSRD